MKMTKPYSLSVKAVIRQADGRLLLLKRSPNCKINVGKWDLPGGKVERGESFDQALIREVLEETGLEISLQRVVGTAERELPEWKVVYLILEGHIVSGDLKLSAEHSEYRWATGRDLLDLELVDQFRPFVQPLTLEQGI
jgi:8-oxo-dGTP diphosphatase